MRKKIILAACLAMAAPLPSWGGNNPGAKLAMHVVPSSDFLGCADLLPSACDSINVDASIAEILAAGGYGYVAFVAYDVQGITGAEFVVTGWPTGRGAPLLGGPHWCPDGALTMGDHLGTGGITSFSCEQASGEGLVLIGYCSFGPLDEEDLPITLEYVASDFSYPNDPHNYVLDCTINYQEDSVVAMIGCTIGGAHTSGPECGGREGDGAGGAGDGFWPVVVETGSLFAYGHRLTPPYVFTFEDGRFLANGIQLIPALHRDPPPKVRVTDAHRARHALKVQAFETAAVLFERGWDLAAVADSILKIYDASSIVRSVVPAGDTALKVRWVGDNLGPEYVLIPGEARRSRVPVGREDVCRAKARLLQLSLEGGSIAFVGAGYELVSSSKNLGRVEEEIRILMETGDPRSEQLELLPSYVAADLLDTAFPTEN